MNVARHRGAPASGHAGYRGEGQFTAIQFGPIFIPHQTETIHHTSAIITSAPVRIGNSFGFALPRSHSDSQSLRFAGATVCAIASSVRRTPASVPDRASVVSR